MAPVYENTQADENGNAVRNGIFLPGDENDIWIDYLSGKQYRGGQVLNNYDAPIWKLPVFVKANAIIPMYEANNNPQAQTADNEKGLDKTRRTPSSLLPRAAALTRALRMTAPPSSTLRTRVTRPMAPRTPSPTASTSPRSIPPRSPAERVSSPSTPPRAPMTATTPFA